MTANDDQWISIDGNLLWLVWAALLAVPLWRIFRRAGLPPALSLVNLLPGAGSLLVLVLLAMLDWPALRRATDGETSR